MNRIQKWLGIELSPKRKAESDKIADDIMNKLLSEHIIAKQAGGDHS